MSRENSAVEGLCPPGTREGVITWSEVMTRRGTEGEVTGEPGKFPHGIPGLASPA
jgi:hypothetical protein